MSSSSDGRPEAAVPSAPPPAGAGDDPGSWVLRAPVTRQNKVMAVFLFTVLFVFFAPPAVMVGPALARDIWPGPRWVHLLGAGVGLMLSLFLLSVLVQLVRLAVAVFRMRTVVGRDGFGTHPLGGPVLVRWPESRSGLFAQLTGLGTQSAMVVVEGWVVTPEGGCRSLPGTRRAGPVAQREALLREVEAELDAIWQWGLRHGATTESGRYIPLRHQLREQVRQVTQAGGQELLPPANGPLGRPSVPVATGSSETRLILEARDHQTFAWAVYQWWLLALGWLMSIPLVISLLVATWRLAMAGDRALLLLWAVLGLLCLAAVVGEVLAGWLLVRTASRRTRRTVATVSGIEVATLTGSRVVPWPKNRAALAPRAGHRRGSRTWTVDAWLTSPQGESFRLAGICVRGPGSQRDIAVEEVNACLDFLWEWGLSHGAVTADDAPRGARPAVRTVEP